MKLPTGNRILRALIAITMISGCSTNERKESGTVELSQDDSVSCQNDLTSSLRNASAEFPDFGDGLDGEFYLAADDEYFLEYRTYNFTNLYTEAGSSLRLTGPELTEDARIELNVLGNCEFHGDLVVAEFSGTLALNCSGLIIFSGVFNLQSGTLQLTSSSIGDPTIWANSNESNLQEIEGGVVISAGSGGVTIDSAGAIDGALTVGDSLIFSDLTLDVNPVTNAPVSLDISEGVPVTNIEPGNEESDVTCD